MNTMKPTPAKILHHFEGMGTPDVETVRQRARELALIDGREQFTEEDWRAAKRELHGGHEFNGSNGETEMSAMVSEHDMTVGSLGRHVENVGLDDADNVLEELIAEGMDEAVHEQMLASRREDVRSSADEEEHD